jgi:acyl-CoA thioesterase-1
MLKNLTKWKETKISTEIDQYNAFAERFCITKNVQFVSFTDITRQGLNNSNLVASDGLAPSETAYKLFVNASHSKNRASGLNFHI